MDGANLGAATARSREVEIPPASDRDRVRRHAWAVLDVPYLGAQRGVRRRWRRRRRLVAEGPHCKRRDHPDNVCDFHDANSFEAVTTWLAKAATCETSQWSPSHSHQSLTIALMASGSPPANFSRTIA